MELRCHANPIISTADVVRWYQLEAPVPNPGTHITLIAHEVTNYPCCEEAEDMAWERRM